MSHAIRQLSWVSAVLYVAANAGAQAPGKLKTAVIQLAADTPLLVYDIRFTGDTTTMPTALKYLVKDVAEYEGWYLTGTEKSKTIASRAKRVSLEYVPARSKNKATRIGKIDVKETAKSIDCVVTFAKKPARDELSRLGGILGTFARKYTKAAKNASATVEHSETAQAAVWNFHVHIEAAAAKAKK